MTHLKLDNVGLENLTHLILDEVESLNLTHLKLVEVGSQMLLGKTHELVPNNRHVLYL